MASPLSRILHRKKLSASTYTDKFSLVKLKGNKGSAPFLSDAYVRDAGKMDCLRDSRMVATDIDATLTTPSNIAPQSTFAHIKDENGRKLFWMPCLSTGIWAPTGSSKAINWSVSASDDDSEHVVWVREDVHL
ncbi:hypothetical protein KP509_10G013600 [Ceratopteris richardii]|uniref:Uncharacterized protein n=1 Tax=Ceratopteris richardii TaxID=49495 RepID=A0A8T2U252_CERRI|nr:hypothetical protein KP509_10G013600 [Ceratopteris richardii]